MNNKIDRKKQSFNFQYEQAIFESDLPFQAKFVALALRSFHGQDGKIYPSIKTIASMTGLSRSSVKRYLQVLVNDGWMLKTLRRGVTKGNSTNLYTLKIPSSPFTRVRDRGSL